MKAELMYECNSLEEVQKASENLDKATMCDLKIVDGGVVKDVKEFKGIYNISRGKFCAAVVPHYNLVQHKGYFDGFATALNRLGIKYKMTLKQSGNRAFADIEFKDRNLKFDKLNEEFTTGIRLVNSYDKSTGLYVMPRFTRLACANGMILTRSEKTVSIKHHTKMVREIEVFIERKVNELINENQDLHNWVSRSMKDSLEWNKCCLIIEKLFSQLKHREEILKRLNISVIENTNKKTKKKSVAYTWNDTKKKKEKITRWELYNAITHYLTHGEQITPHIENLFHKQAEKLLTTPLEKMPMAVVVLNA